MRAERLPDAKRLQHVDGAFASSAAVRVSRAAGGGAGRRTDQRHARPAMGERKRRGKAGGTGSDNGNVDVQSLRPRSILLAS